MCWSLKRTGSVTALLLLRDVGRCLACYFTLVSHASFLLSNLCHCDPPNTLMLSVNIYHNAMDTVHSCIFVLCSKYFGITSQCGAAQHRQNRSSPGRPPTTAACAENYAAKSMFLLNQMGK